MAPVSLYASLAPDQIARIKLRYEQGAMTLAQIAAAEGLLEHQISNLRKRFRWPTRQARARGAIERAMRHEQAIAAAQQEQESATAAASTDAQQPPGDFDAGALVRGVRRSLEQELAALDTQAPSDSRVDALLKLTRALANLRAMERGDTKAERQNEQSPIDIAELRRELSRKLAALREGGEGA